MRDFLAHFSAVLGALVLAVCPLASLQASDRVDAPTASLTARDLSQSIKPLGIVRAPLGLQIFCISQQTHCARGGKAQVEITNDLMHTLELTNARVNQSIRPLKDTNGDIWSIHAAAGDCEDYALTKRAYLVERGVPLNALRIATAYTSSGEAHAVLVLRSDQGDLVLDNRHNAIQHWHQTDLEWVAISGDHLTQWHKI